MAVGIIKLPPIKVRVGTFMIKFDTFFSYIYIHVHVLLANISVRFFCYIIPFFDNPEENSDFAKKKKGIWGKREHLVINKHFLLFQK